MKKLLLVASVLSSAFLYSQDSIARIDSNLIKINPFPVEIGGGYTPLPIFYPPYDIIPIWTLPTSFVWALTESNYNKKGAKRDIKADKMKILFPSDSIKMKFDGFKDKSFQKKYLVEFYKQQKEHNTFEENEKVYNQTIFAFLDEKYGQDWRFEMRNDAIGFEIPDSLFRKKAEEIMASLPEINLENHIKGLPIKKPSVSPIMTMIGIAVPAILLFLAAIFFIFRRKKKSK